MPPRLNPVANERLQVSAGQAKGSRREPTSRKTRDGHPESFPRRANQKEKHIRATSRKTRDGHPESFPRRANQKEQHIRARRVREGTTEY